MALSIETTIGELVDNPDACAILDKHIPGMSTNPQMSMARGFSLSMAASMSGGQITQEQLNAINEDLQKL